MNNGTDRVQPELLDLQSHRRHRDLSAAKCNRVPPDNWDSVRVSEVSSVRSRVEYER